MKHIFTTFKQIITKPLLVACALLAMSGNAWGAKYYARVSVESFPSAAGNVGVNTSQSPSCSSSTASKTGNKNGTGWTGLGFPSIDFYLSATQNSGYVFKGWATSTSATSYSSTTRTNYKVTLTASSLVSGVPLPDEKYYALYAYLHANTPANNSTIDCGDVTIGENSEWKEIKIKHLRAGTISISKSGNSSDFYVASTNNSPASEISSLSSGTSETSTSIYVRFTPTANGLRTCTLTVSSNNGPSSLTYYITGTGYSDPTITWKDGNGNTLTSGETTLSAGDVLKATCTSSQTVSYTDYNTDYFTAGTDESGAPILTVRDDITGTIQNVTVKGNLAKNTTTHYNPYSETFTLNITNLIPQRIDWTDEISDLVNENMPYTVTLNAVAKNAKTGANSGQAITYSMEANDYMSLSGNVLTVKKVGGPITITASAAESELYAPAELKRNATVIDITNPCASSDSHDDFSLSNLNIIGVTITPTLPDQLSFTVKRDGSSLVTKPGLVVTQYDASGNELDKKTKSYNDISESGVNFTIDCNVNAKSITFTMSSVAVMSYKVSNVITTRVTSCTPNQSAISYATEPGQTLSKNLKLSYCNALVFLSLKSDEEADHVGTSKWSLNTTRLGNCGKRGEQFVSISFLSNAKGEYSDVLYIRDNVGNLLSSVNLSANVTVRPQHLDTWNIESTYNTTDQTTLTATTEEGRSNFDFTVQSSTPEGIVSISDAGVMTFNGSGTAQIVAHESGGGIYDEFTSEPYSITINKVTPTIAANPTGTVTFNSALANDQLSGGNATVTLRGVDNTSVEGSFVWKNAGQTVSDKAGENYEYPVVFKPSIDAMYNDVEGIALVTVNRADGSLAMNDGEVEVSITGDEATLNLDELKDSATDNGGLTFVVTSANASAATISTNNFSASVADEYTIEATKAQTDYYTSATATFTVMVNKRTPSVDLSALSSTVINYGEELSQASITGTISVTNSSPAGSETASATCVWNDANIKPTVGTTTAKATFTSATGWFNPIEVDVPITVNPIAATYAATANVYAGQSLSEVELVNATTGLGGETVSGIVVWKNDVSAISFDEDGIQTLPVIFTSSNANYNSGEGLCTITVLPGVVFNGGEWNEGTSWSDGEVPTATDRVIIDANVTIYGDVEVTSLTVNEGKAVTIKDGGKLTVGNGNSLNRTTYGNIIVEAGGQLNLGSGDVQVNDFTLYSGYDEGLPKSGQVSNPTKIHANGNAYFILDLDPAGEASYGWYDFTVPFPVNVMTGVARSADGINWDTNIQNEKNYAVMAFYEELRAQDQYAWKKFRGILEPGRAYTMTIDSKINTYRFAMTQEGTFNTTMTQTLEASAEGEENGWNGVGNGTMQYIKLSEQPVVQMYQHTSNVYLPVDAGSQAFAVGSAYFVQKSEQLCQLTLVPVQDATSVLRAPQRKREADERFGVTLTQDGKTCDNLFVTCSDEATTAYTRGKDVQKMGDIEGAKIARLWTNAKGKNLCAIYTACTGNETVIPMNIYAPAAGAYNIALTSLPEEDIYLTRNGVIVWDLTMSDYTLDLNAGTDNTYALMLVRRINNTATGVDATDNDKRGTDFVEKIIVNGQLYILRDGMMYDAQGKKVTNF